ncbi:hypothetical protein F4553_006398 [Allocatelliglobosispora scoriae]|uniref:Uncharacterized protein n=1 Tax=Allocatelliglobosispora scoriae TaxID=643052 RepID=A0A841BXT0_9ACTN|nr:hypothetical protein [Allocatelliglobosispora scoriae]MBB5872964.1 hypothetical protein [Allocatelliglobosispora scoriae]
MRRRAASLIITATLLAGCGSTADPGEPIAAATSSAPVEQAVEQAVDPGATAGVSGTAIPRPSAPATAACHGFPADNVWRADVSKLPVHRSSSTYVASIGASAAMHPDFGSGTWEGAPIGIPITQVKPGQAKVRVSFEYASESDRGPYPIPIDAKVEGGRSSTGDRHVILVDAPGCRVYELYAAYPSSDGTWRAGSGAVFDLRSNRLRPAGWTSADAAGLSVYAGLVRYDEVAAGRIDHAIRITVPRTRDAYVWPARHQASVRTDAALPPMGLRLRLKASVDISRLPAQARVVAAAMQRYGVIIADNGSSWYISGAPDDRWSNDALRALKGLHGSDFEAVDTSSLMVSKDSGAVKR